ncbi:4-alpha-glucanotransferase [Prosthecobacter fusiformis]|uniref:4-alpha-glucanotransferase n=1 Tax=Prosthecobacter fusiformis TaxID=48464 RepID=A0A4R7S4J5_9BACT|nr:4-alpha-glucanotransferase [Prosthecobacter fusiformis]TDU73350.1 4-alpha-glucanotransferase [Prosthecobacter fusiformis]
MPPPPPLPKKLAGLLVPVFAMRRTDDMGIGDTQAVIETIDFCAANQFAVLQLLPIHETVGDHSPYNPISSRALSPALLTLHPDWVPGLSEEIIKRHATESWLIQLREGPVKHLSVHALKLQILMDAAKSFEEQMDDFTALAEDFKAFQDQEDQWLPAYTLFRVLVHEYEGNTHWEQWRPEHHSLALAESWFAAHADNARLASLRRAFAFVQWVAHRQWLQVRTHAEAQSIKLMGEMSFGVSKSSADVWSRPELFDTEWSMGTRPVSYFDTNKDSERWGQNWGLPPYRWENHRSEKFAWLRGRMSSEAKYFHICRLDHLRGYFRAYMFPWQGGPQHAEFATLSEEEAFLKTNGRLPRFVPGPDDEETTAQMNDLQGRELISIMQEAAGEMGLMAELMGMMPDYMRQALEDLQMPNLTFPLLEKDDEGHLLHQENFRPLSLVSYGNHDHAPLAAVYARLHEGMGKDMSEMSGDLRNLLAFAGWSGSPPDTLTSELLSALQKSLFETPCLLAVLMCTDLIGTAQRFNLPGSYGSMTWCERLELPWDGLCSHPVYGARIKEAVQWVLQSGRAPD